MSESRMKANKYSNFESSSENLVSPSSERRKSPQKKSSEVQYSAAHETKPMFLKPPGHHPQHSIQGNASVPQESSQTSDAQVHHAWKGSLTRTTIHNSSIKDLTKELQKGSDFLHILEEQEHPHRPRAISPSAPSAKAGSHRTTISATAPQISRTPSASTENPPRLHNMHTKSFRGSSIAELNRELRGMNGGRDQALRDLRAQMVHPPAAPASAVGVRRGGDGGHGSAAAAADHRDGKHSPLHSRQRSGPATSPGPESGDEGHPSQASPRARHTPPRTTSGSTLSGHSGRSANGGSFRSHAGAPAGRAENGSGPGHEGSREPHGVGSSGGGSLAARVARALARSLQCLPLSA